MLLASYVHEQLNPATYSLTISNLTSVLLAMENDSLFKQCV